MTDPSLPDNDAFELAQRIAEECSVDHSWFHFTKCATLIEQFVAERLAAMEARGTTEEAISALTARVAELEGERERLREALLAADRDISEWLQLAKRQANELPNADYHPLAPTRLGIAASNEVRELIKSVFHVNIHGEVEYRET
jgi:hypothetical protein